MQKSASQMNKKDGDEDNKDLTIRSDEYSNCCLHRRFLSDDFSVADRKQTSSFSNQTIGTQFAESQKADIQIFTTTLIERRSIATQTDDVEMIQNFNRRCSTCSMIAKFADNNARPIEGELLTDAPQQDKKYRNSTASLHNKNTSFFKSEERDLERRVDAELEKLVSKKEALKKPKRKVDKANCTMESWSTKFISHDLTSFSTSDSTSNANSNLTEIFTNSTLSSIKHHYRSGENLHYDSNEYDYKEDSMPLSSASTYLESELHSFILEPPNPFYRNGKQVKDTQKYFKYFPRPMYQSSARNSPSILDDTNWLSIDRRESSEIDTANIAMYDHRSKDSLEMDENDDNIINGTCDYPSNKSSFDQKTGNSFHRCAGRRIHYSLESCIEWMSEELPKERAQNSMSSVEGTENERRNTQDYSKEPMRSGAFSAKMFAVQNLSSASVEKKKKKVAENCEDSSDEEKRNVRIGKNRRSGKLLPPPILEEKENLQPFFSKQVGFATPKTAKSIFAYLDIKYNSSDDDEEEDYFSNNKFTPLPRIESKAVKCHLCDKFLVNEQSRVFHLVRCHMSEIAKGIEERDCALKEDCANVQKKKKPLQDERISFTKKNYAIKKLVAPNFLTPEDNTRIFGNSMLGMWNGKTDENKKSDEYNKSDASSKSGSNRSDFLDAMFDITARIKHFNNLPDLYKAPSSDECYPKERRRTGYAEKTTPSVREMVSSICENANLNTPMISPKSRKNFRTSNGYTTPLTHGIKKNRCSLLKSLQATTNNKNSFWNAIEASRKVRGSISSGEFTCSFQTDGDVSKKVSSTPSNISGFQFINSFSSAALALKKTREEKNT